MTTEKSSKFLTEKEVDELTGIRRVVKKAAGGLLDGVQQDG